MKSDDGSRWLPDQVRVEVIRTRAVELIFGDQYGIMIFLGGLVFFGIYWRVGFLITDNWTLANTLVAISEGQLHVDRTVYGPPRAQTPGLYVVNDQFYGRNYGQLFLALPVLFAIEAISLVADIRIAVAGIWSLLLLAFVRRLGTLLEQEFPFALVGSVCALIALAINTAFALPLSPRMYHLMALQVYTMLVAAMIGVVLYRLISDIHERRMGVFIGAATILATPIGFWASVPKRHVLVSLLTLIAFYSYYRAQIGASSSGELKFRSISYASLGLMAWIVSPIALVCLLILAPIDLLTARFNSPRRLIIIGGVFFLSLLPFFTTNTAITGHPLKPVLLSGRRTGTPTGDVSTGGGETLLGPLQEQFSSILTPGQVISTILIDGMKFIVTEPSRVFHSIVTSDPNQTTAAATSLSLLESTPIFGLLIVLPIIAAIYHLGSPRRYIESTSIRFRMDLMAVGFITVFFLVYIQRLPGHAAQFTVRYLLPTIPFGMYFISHFAAIKRVLADRAYLFTLSYASLLLIGGQFIIVLLFPMRLSQGEVVQFHGLLGLIAASIVGIWLTVATFRPDLDARVGAVALAIPLAAGTLYVLLSGIEYFVIGRFALAMSDLLSDAIPLF